MKILPPIPITDAMLVSSTVAENDAPAYSASTTYAKGQRAISGHRVYESTQASNLNHPVTDPTWWIDVGPTKRWACFDQAIGTLCTGASPLEIVLAPGQSHNAVALLEISGIDTVRVRSKAGSVTVYDRTIDLRAARNVATWLDYFFQPIDPATQAIFDDLPISVNNQITVTCTGAAPSLGVLAVGLQREFGQAQYGTSIGIIDYSVKNTDTFGVTTVVQRAFAKRAQVSHVLPRAQVDAFTRLLASLRATPAIWRVDDIEEALTIYGWCRDWTQTIAYPTLVTGDLTLEGLI